MIEIDPTFELGQIPGGFVVRSFESIGMSDDNQVGKFTCSIALSKRECLMRLSRHIDALMNSDEVDDSDLEEVLA